MKIEFKEEQKFTKWWLWLILLPIGLMLIIGIYKQIFLRESFGDKPMSDIGLIIFTIFIFSLLGLFILMKMKTKIDHDKIELIFYPFVNKTTKWTEIKKAEVVNYGFVGGWGIRFSTKYGTVYNIKGNKGLAIELLNGKKYLIGTQKDTEIKEILKKAFRKQNV